jgi:uncharacterized repeat protein (TIGR01451 family)
MPRIAEGLLRFCLIVILTIMPFGRAMADLRSAPTWYDQNAVSSAPDWHYRVPIVVPSGTAPGATVKVDVNFAALLSNLGVSGTFDVNSPRVVRSTGALAGTQEFTDRVFGGVTDSAGDAKGEIRFLLEDSAAASAVTYYLYFDVSQNGVKPANPQTPINGNFEVGASGTVAPSGWAAPAKTAGIDGEMRPAESVSVSSSPTPVDGVNPRTTDGTPQSGSFSYLLGNRSSATGGITSNPGVTFTRDFVVPTTNPGSITFRYRPEGWDTGDFDPVRIDLVTTANVVLVEMLGPTAGAYTTKPFAPNTNNAQATNTTSGYRQYNGFDCTLAGGHTLGMTVACHSEPWFTVTQSLAAYAGQTVRFRVRYFSDNNDKTWYHLDDVEWSVVTATLGTAQGFGVNITTPAAGGNYAPGQAIPLVVQVDADPGAASNPVTAQLYDSTGTLVTGGPYLLYNDGTHGDAVAGDALWSNNNSIPAQPAPTIPVAAASTTGWTMRVFGRDGSSSSIGAQNGLIRGPGSGAAAETQANFWNIDEILFNVQGAAVSIVKSSSVVSDPVNGVSANAKAIPGAVVRYCLLITNGGPATAGTIIATDTLPLTTSFVSGSMKSGASCATAATVEDDNNSGADESDPFGASYAGGTLISITSSLANGGVMALIFDATIL